MRNLATGAVVASVCLFLTGTGQARADDTAADKGAAEACASGCASASGDDGAAAPAEASAATSASAAGQDEGQPASPQHLAAEHNLLRQIQEALAELGYDPGEPDGERRPQTQAAIEQFQTEMDIEVTGEPSVELLTLMIERLADR